MRLTDLHNSSLLHVLRLALLGILVGIGIHIAFNVSVALATSCAAEEALRVKLKTINTSDEQVTFPNCALVDGSQAEWVVQGGIVDYRDSETSRERFFLVYRIEATQ